MSERVGNIRILSRIYTHGYLTNVYEGSRILSSLGFSLAKKGGQNKNGIHGTSSSTETKLLWTKYSLSFHYISHLMTHPGSN